MDNPLPWLRLQYTPGLGRAGLFHLINSFGSAEQALDAAKRGWPKLPGLREKLAGGVPAADDPKIGNACNILEQCGGWLCSYWDPEYPDLLRSIPDPPALLYGRGRWPSGIALAIVGSRTPSEVGRKFTEEVAEALATAGLTIISGLARGIDTAAHRGALAGNGQTLAVLGCGIDCIYPRENAHLFEQIAAEGALLSEYPPGSEPLPGHFPGRNRIISGLSSGTLVVEAARDSGSLITAEFALEQGREVLAVPGSVDRKTSYGPNLLIKQGAHPVTEAADILSVFGVERCARKTASQSTLPLANLSPREQELLEHLYFSPRCSDELSRESGLTPSALSVILLHLELQGYVEKQPGGRYVRGRRAP